MMYGSALGEWMIEDWGFLWRDPVMKSIVSRLFESSIEPLVNIILDFETWITTEGGKL